MSYDRAISRRSLLWLIGCLVAVVLPHLGRIPSWILLVYVGASFWRLQMMRSRAQMPGRLWRLTLGIAAGTGIYLSYRTLLGLEPMVALLLVATALKLLETLRARDGYVLVCLGFFICITSFLFSQELPVALYALLATLLLVAALIVLNQHPDAPVGFAEPLLALKMLALAVPMMAVLFVLFPRIGPLWSVPSKTGQGTTGMSDILRPGDVSKLGRSAEVAFRVRFDGETPPRSSLYWRGMVLNRFDQGTWRTTNWRSYPLSERRLERPDTPGPAISYRVIMEPTYQRWLYALPYAESPSPGVVQAWDYRLTRPEPVENQFSYQVQSWPDAPLQPRLSSWRRTTELAFPATLNPRSRQWIRALQRENPQPEQLVRAVLRYFQTQPFFYTLQPTPIADPDFVDRFLFDTRRGFCEHYAYSFVTLMRQAGIPARIIGGYQGGEVNPINNALVVRQFDAHAWAEVWFEGRGWTRVDPTAAVSPERITLGLEQALAGEAGFLADSPLSAYRFRDYDLVNWFRLHYDALAWQWQSFIIGFDSGSQIDLLKRWFGDIRVSWFVAVLLGSWAAVLIPLTLWINRSRRRVSRLPDEERFVQLCARLEKRGIRRYPGESATALLARALTVLPTDDPLIRALEDNARALYRQPPELRGQVRRPECRSGCGRG